MQKLNWGILSTARIGLQQVIPAIQKSTNGRVTAIASRSPQKAAAAAGEAGISTSYGTYEELLEDPGVDAIYNPLPNNMHLEWNVKAMEAGKHVLCEKPLGLSVPEVEEMISVRDRCRVKAGEAFMVKSHPQWRDVRTRIRNGDVGELRLVQGAFSYFNTDPDNIRNIPGLGGGGIWDIGCYCVTMSRYVFGEEPVRLVSSVDTDPEFGTDRLAGVIMEFPTGKAVFTVGTQVAAFQRMHILGTGGHMEVKIPFNAPSDRPNVVLKDEGSILLDAITKLEYPPVNQYQLMVEEFSRAVLRDEDVPVPLEDSLWNTKVLCAVFDSAKKGTWVEVKQ